MPELATVDGYGHKAPSDDPRLTEVGPGTRMGEAMRRCEVPPRHVEAGGWTVATSDKTAAAVPAAGA